MVKSSPKQKPLLPALTKENIYEGLEAIRPYVGEKQIYIFEQRHFYHRVYEDIAKDIGCDRNRVFRNYNNILNLLPVYLVVPDSNYIKEHIEEEEIQKMACDFFFKHLRPKDKNWTTKVKIRISHTGNLALMEAFIFKLKYTRFSTF